MASGLNLPLIFWNKNSPEIHHEITAFVMAPTTLVTGSSTGDLVFWTFREGCFSPRTIATPSLNQECKQLVVLSGPRGSRSSSGIYVVSLHADNRIRIWDAGDGRCISSTTSTTFSNSYHILRIAGIQKRLVAVGGYKTIHILDTWTMTRMCSYKIAGILVDMKSQSVGDGSRLVALHGNGYVTVWDFQDSGDLSSPPNFDFSRPTAKLTMQMKEFPSKLAISKDFRFIAVAYEHSISIIHETWVRFT